VTGERLKRRFQLKRMMRKRVCMRERQKDRDRERQSQRETHTRDRDREVVLVSTFASRDGKLVFSQPQFSQSLLKIVLYFSSGLDV
jgi:hypothetical protein